MIYIDYYSGSHGQFLEFLIAKHILCIPEYKNFIPFTKSGASHREKPINPYNLVCADHFTHWPSTGVKLNEEASNTVIQIIIEHNVLQDIFLYNVWQRTAMKPADFNDINSILTKIDRNHYPEIINRQTVRNMIYSMIREEYFVTYPNNYANYNVPTLKVKFENFYSYDGLLFELEKIAKHLSKSLYTDTLRSTWEKFIELHAGFQIKQKINEIFKAILQDIDSNLKLDIYEEACLNSKITNFFNIHSDLSIFNIEYPENTLLISKDIKNILHKRNSEFSINLPIEHQLEKIIVDF